MRSIIRFSLNNKFALWIMTLIVLFTGIYAGTNMKMETLPDITIPIVRVTTSYQGAAPAQVMEAVTKPIEDATKNLNGVDSVTSTSYENTSSVVVQYKYGKDMDKAQDEVQQVLSTLSLPAGVGQPSVSRISLNAFPILSLSASSSSQNLADLTKTIENDIVPQLQGAGGVASVSVTGQYVNQAELSFNDDKLRELGLTQDSVTNAIKSAVKASLGILEFGNSDKAVVVDGSAATIDDLKNLEIPVVPSAGAAKGGQGAAGMGAASDSGQSGTIELPTVKLGDVADIKVTGKAESITRTNGKDSIGISIVKSADANTVDVVDAVKASVKDLESTHSGLSVTATFDQGAPIKSSVETMLTKAVLGAAFAILIILIFLRNFQSTIIAVVSIPLSLLIAVLLLEQMDISLNIMTLGAMTVAIGRVVDDSIVVIENIYRRMSLSGEKLKGKELILESTREMFVPIMSSTVVTIAVFLPLGFVSGAIGQIFRPFAYTIVFALLASLVVAITIVPMLAHAVFKNGLKAGATHEEKPGRIVNFYKGALRWSLNHKGIAFGVAVLLLIGSLGLVPLIGTSYISNGGDNSMIVSYNPAPGETLENVETLAATAEDKLMARSGLETIQYSVGGSNPMNPGASKQALFNLTYTKDFKDFADEQKNIITELQGLGGKGAWQQQNFGGGGGGIGGSSLTVTAYGPDMETLQPIVKGLETSLKDVKSLDNIDSSLSEAYEEYRIVPDSQKMAANGLSAGQLAMALSPVRQNPALTTIKYEDSTISLYTKVDTQTYTDKASLENKEIVTPLGTTVKLKDVATIVDDQSPNTITRQDDKIYASVTADVTSKNVQVASKDVQKIIDQLQLPSGVTVTMGGVTEDIGSSFSQLGLAMLIAIAIVYLILVITFGGALTPLVVLFSLPFTVIGALVGLLVARETISVTAMIGMLMLIGIVVTNAIVLIDRVIQKEKDGLNVREALMEAAGTRLRPILMTAIATVGALLPLAFGYESSGALISKGLGVTVIGGLISSTLLTLIIVPVVYEFFNRKRLKRQRAAVK